MMRVGIGWDVHPLVEGRNLVLGGVEFANESRGLAGRSDADVVCHAICDALLGSLSLGDIGERFPDDDPRYENFPSVRFLEMVRDLVKSEGWEILNVDCTVMSDAVKLGQRKREMSKTIASYLGLEQRRVSVKATTWEGHGSVGRGEVIACQAIALVGRSAL